MTNPTEPLSILSVVAHLEAIAEHLNDHRTTPDPNTYTRVTYAQTRINEAIQFLAPLIDSDMGTTATDSSVIFAVPP